MADPYRENPRLMAQHLRKNRMGSRELNEKPGKRPPHKGDPEQVENVPGREPLNPHRRPDPDETYRTGRQGPGRT
jgi:hypothetical protein